MACYFADVGSQKGTPRRLEPEAKAFRAHLAALIIRSGMKPAEISRRSGFKQTIISRLVNGQRRPDLSTLIRLANGLNISLDELVGRKWPKLPGDGGDKSAVIQRGYEGEFVTPKDEPIGPKQEPGTLTGSLGKSRRTKGRG